jgi:hypothetical protein
MTLTLLLLPTLATAQTVFGGYEVGADYTAYADIVEVLAEISTALPTFADAKTIYESGSQSDPAGLTEPTLQQFAKGTGSTNYRNNRDYSSGNTVTAFETLFPATGDTMWDDVISAALTDGGLTTALTGDDLETLRSYAVSKGLLGVCIFEALNLLDAALALGPSDDAQDMVDNAWAVYYGSRDDAVKSAAEVTAKRESSGDFGTTGLNVFSRLHFAFKQTRDALAASGGSTTAAADGVKLIKKMIVLTFARATIKYSHARKETAEAADYSAKYHMRATCTTGSLPALRSRSSRTPTEKARTPRRSPLRRQSSALSRPSWIMSWRLLTSLRRPTTAM